jgi:long-chain acyl-CoA synthetase
LRRGARLLLALADVLVFRTIRARFGGRLRFAVSGAAALSPEAGELMEAIGVTVYQGYGLTEASPVVSANFPGQSKRGSVGRPLPNVTVEIDHRHRAGDDVREGEIVVRGPNVMVGYHSRDGENRAIFDEARGLRTGDLGYLDGDGFLYITGRIKDQYKLSNGKYVAPVRLEDRLKLSPRIASVMIYGDNRPHNVALVVPCAGDLAALIDGRLSKDELRRAIAADIQHLSQDWKGYERIRTFALLTEDFTQANQLLTPSLKLKRRLIVQRWGHQIERLYSESPGTNAISCGVRAASE